MCGNSDPGRNGLLSPWGKIEGLYFDDSDEIGNFLWNLQKDLEEYYGKTGKVFVKIKADDEKSYYDTLYKLQSYYEDVRCYGTSIDGSLDIVVDTEDFFNDDKDVSVENITTGRHTIATESEK